eukprot:m.307853 g.307853  ORF g.307853 m.307853 type:complete len:253 (+) comp42938_c0_seq1:142-900(+)
MAAILLLVLASISTILPSLCRGDTQCGSLPGSRQNPQKKSCDNLDDGIYYFRLPGCPLFKSYCYKRHILVLKTNGNKDTFDYDADLWANDQLLGGEAVALDDGEEAKLAPYGCLPWNSMIVGMKQKPEDKMNEVRIWVPDRDSLKAVISPGEYVETKSGRDAWKQLVDGSSLQSNCNKEGFNIESTRSVRIGIIGNEQEDCQTPDSHIGIGSKGDNWRLGRVPTGNDAAWYADNGDKTIRTYGFVFIRFVVD